MIDNLGRTDINKARKHQHYYAHMRLLNIAPCGAAVLLACAVQHSASTSFRVIDEDYSSAGLDFFDSPSEDLVAAKRANAELRAEQCIDKVKAFYLNFQKPYVTFELFKQQMLELEEYRLQMSTSLFASASGTKFLVFLVEWVLAAQCGMPDCLIVKLAKELMPWTTAILYAVPNALNAIAELIHRKYARGELSDQILHGIVGTLAAAPVYDEVLEGSYMCIERLQKLGYTAITPSALSRRVSLAFNDLQTAATSLNTYYGSVIMERLPAFRRTCLTRLILQGHSITNCRHAVRIAADPQDLVQIIWSDPKSIFTKIADPNRLLNYQEAATSYLDSVNKALEYLASLSDGSLLEYFVESRKLREGLQCCEGHITEILTRQSSLSPDLVTISNLTLIQLDHLQFQAMSLDVLFVERLKKYLHNWAVVQFPQSATVNPELKTVTVVAKIAVTQASKLDKVVNYANIIRKLPDIGSEMMRSALEHARQQRAELMPSIAFLVANEKILSRVDIAGRGCVTFQELMTEFELSLGLYRTVKRKAKDPLLNASRSHRPF